MLKTKLFLLLCLLSAILLPGIATATTYNWTGLANANWNNSGNWTGGSAGTTPGSGDDVRIGVVVYTGSNPTINATGLSCATLTTGNLNTVIITVSNAFTVNGIITIKGTTTFSGTKLITSTGVSVNAFTFNVNTPLTSTGTFSTNGSTITSNAAGIINTAGLNLTTTTATFNGVINSTGSVQVGTGSASTLTTNATGNNFSAGVYNHTGSDLTWNGSGTTTCSGGDVSSGQTLTIGVGNTVTFTSNFQLHGSNPLVGMLVNNGTINSSSSIFSDNINTNVTAITNGVTGVINLTTSAGQISVGTYTSLSNSGKINCAASTNIGTANPSTVTNNTTGTITLTGATLNMVGGSTLTNSGKILANTASTVTTGNPVTFTNNTTGILTFDASTANFNGGTTISNSGAINGNNSSTINAGNPVPITNTSTSSISLSASILNLAGGSHIDNSGSVSAIAGSNITFANPSYINNLTSASSLTVTASTLDVAAGAYLTNSGTITTSSTSAIKLNGNPASITNNVNSTVNMTSTTITMVAGSFITNTGGAVTMTTCTVNASGNPTNINNNVSGAIKGTFVIDDTDFNFSGTNNITNAGIFTAKNTSTINMNSSANNGTISNSGTFYAGLSNSPVVITLDGSQPKLTNQSSSFFYVGSTSIIYPTSTNCQLSNSGTFTLQSDQYGSAAIGAVPVGANPSPSITGTYNVERFFQGGTTYDNVKKRYLWRNYRIISSPVNTGSQVNSNYIYGLNYIVGATAGQTTAASSTTNAFITGATGGSTSAGNPSTYLYRENKATSNASFTGGNFVGITNITTASSLGTTDAGSWTIPVGNGVLFFFRGNATSWSTRTASPFIAPENATLTSTGTLNQGSITVKDWYTPTSSNLGCTNTTGSLVKGFNMIGNPYACTIDVDKISTGGITATNIDPTIYVLNPKTNQYDTFSTSTHLGNTTTFLGKIASGEGFFVKALNSSATFTFNEACKAPTSLQTVAGGDLYMGAPVQQEVAKLLRLKLSLDSNNYDDIIIGFKSSASAKYSGYEDAKDLGGINATEGLSSMSADAVPVPLAINFLPLPKQQALTIPLSVNATVSGQFTLQRVALDSLAKIYEVWLMDKYKKDSLDLRNNKSYVFNIDLADTLSYGDSRFSIVVRQNKAMGLHLLDFTAVKATDGAQVAWKTENEENYTNFTVERSTDNGVTFDVLGGFLSSSQSLYNFTDKTPAKAVNTYHLKMEDLNGTISYSKNIALTYGDATAAATNNIAVYPNPASGTINLAIKPDTRANLLSGIQSINKNPTLQVTSAQSYAIKIVNISGNVVKSAISSKPTWQDDVGTLLPGTYIIQVLNNTDKSLVGKTTFVKM